MEKWMVLLEEQLAIDYNCTVEDVRGSGHIFRPIRMHEKRRING